MKKTIRDRIAKLAVMNVPALREEDRKLFGKDPVSSHRQFLLRKVAWRLQADEEGWQPDRIRELARGIARDTPLRQRVVTNHADDILAAFQDHGNASERVARPLDRSPPVRCQRRRLDQRRHPPLGRMPAPGRRSAESLRAHRGVANAARRLRSRCRTDGHRCAGFHHLTPQNPWPRLQPRGQHAARTHRQRRTHPRRRLRQRLPLR